jgi:hypothetical protein
LDLSSIPCITEQLVVKKKYKLTLTLRQGSINEEFQNSE